MARVRLEPVTLQLRGKKTLPLIHRNPYIGIPLFSVGISFAADANYDYIDAAISTDAGPAKDQRYELTQRERSPTVDHAGAVATSGQKDVPAMYDRFRRQTYDYEIPTGDKSQPYLQTRDIEIPVHTEDKSQPYVSLYE